MDFELIQHYVSAFELDNRDMRASQFLVAKYGKSFSGFGRIRIHDGCDEFCSLGILEDARGSGIGKALIEAIIKASTQPLYLACIIPKYFMTYGFQVVKSYPPQMKDKLDYCNGTLPVIEEYVVMKYFSPLKFIQ